MSSLHDSNHREVKHGHNRNIPAPYPDETFWHNSISDRVPNSLKFGYEFVCLTAGATIIVIVADVTEFAENCGLSTSASSYAFSVQGVGTLLGGIMASWLLAQYHGNHVIVVSSIVGALFSVTLPFLSSAVLLFVYYFVLGVVTNILFTTAFFMMRATLAHHAGPWMSLGQVFYGLGGVTLTAIDVAVFYTMTTCSICTISQYVALGLAYIALIIHFFYIARDPQEQPSLIIEEHEPGYDNSEGDNEDILVAPPELKGQKAENEALRRREEELRFSDPDPFSSDRSIQETPSERRHRHRVAEGAVKRMEAAVPHYHVEIVLCVIMISITGGLFTLMAYLTTYVQDLNLESYDAGYAQVTVGYAFSVIAVAAGFLDQANNIQNQEQLFKRLLLCTFFGGAVMIFPLIFPDSLVVLWISTTVYMTLNGPTYGYTYDWMNRLTYTSETGTAIVTFGMNASAAIVVVIVVAIWYTFGAGPMTLMYSTVLSMWLAIPLLWLAQHLSYRKDVIHSSQTNDRRGNYQPIPDDD